MSTAKGRYIIPDSKLLRPNSGPSEHILTGIRYLGLDYDIDTLVPGEAYEQTEENEVKARNATKVKFASNGLIGLLRDLKTLLKNHKNFTTYYKDLKQRRPDFVYERAEYLNYNGIIACRLLKIPHFYEVNWVFFREIKQFYHSYFNPVAKFLEEWAYNRSQRSFFVGNQNQFLNLRKDNWEVIQNGIPLDTMLKYQSRIHEINGKVQCCVVAKLMPHHRFDILVEALKKMKHAESLHFHFIGYEFEEALKEVPPKISYTFHGPVSRLDLPQQIAQYQLGVISGGMHYASFMKLYEYAAVKLMVVCPELENLVRNFSDAEIMFFENESSDALADCLDRIVENPQMIQDFGDALYEKVQERYTWEAIFGKISQEILKQLPQEFSLKSKIRIQEELKTSS